MSVSETVQKRVTYLVTQQIQSPQEDGDYSITLELCDIMRRHGTEAVLEGQLKQFLKYGPILVQLKAIRILNQCVLCSGPNVAIALSVEKWTDRFIALAKSTPSSEVRDAVMKQVMLWFHKYRINGLEQCLGRMARNKALSNDFTRISREVEMANEAQRQQQQQQHQQYVDPASAMSSNSSSTGTNSSMAAGARNRSMTTAANPNYNNNSNNVAQGQVLQGTVRNRAGTTLANPNQHATINQSRRAQSSDTAQGTSLTNVETLILDAQGDLANLEYGLSHPDMLDDSTAKDCKRHKMQVGRLLQMENIPDVYAQSLMELLENLSNTLEMYEVLTGVDLGEGGLDRFASTNPRGSSHSREQLEASLRGEFSRADADVEDPDGDNDGGNDDAAENRRALVAVKRKMGLNGSMTKESSADHTNTTAAMLEAQQETARLMEQERQELQAVREELGALRKQHETLQAKFKDAKTKNKKALELLTENGAQADKLEQEVLTLREALANGGGGAAAVPPPPQVVEKIVYKKTKLNPETVDRMTSDLVTMRRSLKEIRNEFLGDWTRDFKLVSSQVSSAVSMFVSASQKDRQHDQKALQWAQELYKKEMKLRKQYYNQIQELKGNIRVYCRVRPMSQKEEQDGHTSVVQFPSSEEIRIVDERNGRSKMFEFDNVYSPETSQAQVFADTEPLIDSVVDGYNVCIFAYGQTGSGKTFTMSGYGEKGINKRALDRLFHIIEDRKESETSTVHVSVLEIYCEQIRDLLAERGEAQKLSYEVKTGGPCGNYVTNLLEVPVVSASAIDDVINKASLNRSEGKTDMNAHSSRSHMILYVIVRTKNNHTGVQSYGKLSLVDLAGSERLDKSGAEGQTAKEAVAINKSLSALGDVIAGLANTGTKHVPFRNSTLTFLLQDSMAGQAKVLMFCCVSPASYNASESSSSLQFASRARGVSLGQVKKNVVN